MKAARARWAISFADLCLLLMGFLILAHAQPQGGALAASVRQAFHAKQPDTATLLAASLFEPREAVLTPAGRQAIADFAKKLGDRHVRLDSAGVDRGGGRLDGWELAAARTAAAARALVAAGVPEDRIGLAIERTEGTMQQLTLVAL